MGIGVKPLEPRLKLFHQRLALTPPDQQNEQQLFAPILLFGGLPWPKGYYSLVAIAQLLPEPFLLTDLLLLRHGDAVWCKKCVGMEGVAGFYTATLWHCGIF